MYRRYLVCEQVVALRTLLLDGVRWLSAGRGGGSSKLSPCHTLGTRAMENRPNISNPTSPIPIVRRGITLAPISLGSFSAPSDRMFAPSPMPSPPSSPPAPSSPSGLVQATKDSLRRAVDKRDSKSSSLAIDEDMRDMCYYYSKLGTGERSEFLVFMATGFPTNQIIVEQLLQQKPQGGIEHGEEGAQRLQWEGRLRQAIQPPHHWIFSQISRLSGGVKFLVDMRQDLLVTLHSKASDPFHTAVMKTLDYTLRELLSLWFTVGLLNVQRITWESPCNMLQKVSEYEAVHPVRNWTDLKRRVGLYRRCFIFTHSCMPKEPLVLLHIFLTSEISRSMTKILQSSRAPSFDEADENSMKKETEDPSLINTAIFYSITSTQKGLQGIELGNYLIKRVVHELRAEFPQMTQFSSLSPIPGFVKWLNGTMTRAARDELNIFTEEELNKLKLELEVETNDEVYNRLKKLFTTNGWVENDNLTNTLEMPLMRLCAHYLYSEKRRGNALDSVANFHLKNGAVMWRINWQADRSPRGLTNSCGIMVNYRYFLDECDNNCRTYLESSRIAASDSVTFLAQSAALVMKTSPTSNASPPPLVRSPTPPIITITPDSKM